MTPAQLAALSVLLRHLEACGEHCWSDLAREALRGMDAEGVAAKHTAEREAMEAHR